MDRLKSTPASERTEAEIRFSSWEVFKLIYVVNIFRGEMTLELPWEPKVGAAILVKLVPPSGPPIALDALVKLATPVPNRPPAPGTDAPPPNRFQVGVRFQNVDAPKRAAIEQAIRAHTFGGLTMPVGATPKKE